MAHRQQLRHAREPRAERRTGIKLVLQAAHDIVDVRMRPARAHCHLRPAALERAERPVPPLVRRAAQLPRALRARGVRGYARRALRAEAFLVVLLDESGAEFVRQGRAEEGVQLKAGLLDEARRKRLHGAGLEIHGIQELGQERDVFLREGVFWQRWVGVLGVGLEVSLG